MSDAKTDKTMDCPRCDGTGVYQTFGVCYRCHGRKTVKRTAPRKPKAALVETAEERETRLRALMGDADYEAVYGAGGYYDREEA